MQTTIIQRYLHTSPRKLRLVADMVRKMSPLKSLDILEFTPKDAAKDLSKAIKTALASAKDQGVKLEGITFKAIEINEGPVMKRFRAAARGRARGYKKRMSHIKIVLSDEISKPAVTEAVKTDTPKKTRAKKEAK